MSAEQSHKLPFTETEIAAMRSDDRGAASAIIGIMVVIFMAGVIGYLSVCIWVA